MSGKPIAIRMSRTLYAAFYLQSQAIYLFEAALLVQSTIGGHSRSDDYEKPIVSKDTETYSVSVYSAPNDPNKPQTSATKDATSDDPGESLVMVSASGEVRDEIRSIVRDYLDHHVRMLELEFQP
ncbi:uncharacterized protein BO80DRAFT_464362 [Aspergillus ibericus CBS 121593]|uniref:Uncharacterized protein n=1 Tax=Aspergillus ibericus CBS 121593 TaxID=1448316 RepID=A0A395H0R9_9EURO|nr:hypothetical protein BO80DRAFT_464362 [Aspergillus ibericus CBS 121593]RAL01431.1 hypothetical protein BO80DRAFT_464362 [Aspergillus ibericus CBS 121593]